MIESREVDHLFNKRYIHGAFIAPKPVGDRAGIYGKWVVILETDDGDTPMGTQRGKFYTFGTLDSAVEWITDMFGATTVWVETDYEIG
jgi:hypothetical protein